MERFIDSPHGEDRNIQRNSQLRRSTKDIHLLERPKNTAEDDHEHCRQRNEDPGITLLFQRSSHCLDYPPFLSFGQLARLSLCLNWQQVGYSECHANAKRRESGLEKGILVIAGTPQ